MEFNQRFEVAELSTPIGLVGVAVADGRLLRAVHFDGGVRSVTEALARRWPGVRCEERQDPAGATSALAAYFAGSLDALDAIAVDPMGTAFQRAVWLALRGIPAGATRSYGELARALGVPRAVRAVGAANGANPIPLVLPCHRVIGADGTLTGYGGGLDRKRWLLSHERASWRERGRQAAALLF